MPFYKKVELRKVSDKKYGSDQQGLFAVEKIFKGEELIYEFNPSVEEWPYYHDQDNRGKYTKAELLQLIKDKPMLKKFITRQTYMVDDDLFNAPFKYANLELTNVDECEKRFVQSLFINHSCYPNIGFTNPRKCYARRDIEIGEEITQDYGCLLTEDSFQAGTLCQCGWKNKCRTILHLDDYKDPLWRRENQQFCLPYVKKKISSLLSRGSLTSQNVPTIASMPNRKNDYVIPADQQNISEDFSFRGLNSLKCIHHYICEIAESRNGQKLGIVLGEQSLTYFELITYSQQLSLDLIKKYSIDEHCVICLCIQRSMAMVIGMISIIMCGSIYCPLSPDDPIDRLLSLMDQVGAKCVLTDDVKKFKGVQAIDVESIFQQKYLTGNDLKLLSKIKVDANDISHLIFTSGSTGVPKAIQIRHKNVVSSLMAISHLQMMSSESIVLQNTPCSFDVHIQEIIGTLYFGGTIIMLPPYGNLNLKLMCTVLESQRVTFLFGVPTLLKSLLNHINDSSNGHQTTLQSLSVLCSGGEQLNTDVIKSLSRYLNSDCKIYNIYGPAEFSIMTTFYLIDLNCLLSNKSGNIPIGKPISNAECMILNERHELVATGEIGELYIGGTGLFAGYLGHDEWTRQAVCKFHEKTVYKTGDLVYLDEFNNLHFVGRVDFQVKLHGKRIEVGEIEQTIMNYSTSISNCIVVKTVDERKSCEHLTAYVECKSTVLREADLIAYCHMYIPSYMVPQSIIVLENFPLSRNGKIDRKSLARIQAQPIHFAAPHSESEKLLAKICQEVLHVEYMSVNDNIFHLGANSILINQMQSKIHQQCGLDLSIKSFYEYPTLALLADYCKSKLKQELKQNFQPTLPEYQSSDEKAIYKHFPTTEIQEAYLVGQNDYTELGRVPCFSYHEYDSQPDFNVENFERAVNDVIQRHETLRTIFPSVTQQIILEQVPYYKIHVEALDETFSVERHLIRRRTKLSNQMRPPDQWPLFDIQLSRLIIDKKQVYRIHIGFHILILDLWSLNIVLNELSQLYHITNTVLPHLFISYRDYTMSARKLIAMSLYEKCKLYWLNRMENFPFGPILPMRRLPTELRKQKFRCLQHYLDEAVWARLKQEIKSSQLSIAGFLVAVYALVLGKRSENKRFSINLPVFHRLPIHPDINQLVGNCTSIILLEIDLEQSVCFHRFVHLVQNQLWNDLEHVTYNGVAFIRQIMQHNHTRSCLFPYVFTCGIMSNDQHHINICHNMNFYRALTYSITQTPQVYLDNEVYEQEGQLIIQWNYVNNLFHNEFLQDMLNEYVDLLKMLAQSADVWQNHIITPLSKIQTQRRLSLNNTKWFPNQTKRLLHNLIIDQATRTPDAYAILSDRENITYKQLIDRAYMLVHRLRQTCAKRKQLIGILMPKGWEQVAACLAVLMMTGAYLPLDVDSPYERILALIEESEIDTVLSHSNYHSRFDKVTLIKIDQLILENNADTSPILIEDQESSDLAYIIYTSGSTGRPKGVMISHRAVLNTIIDINDRLGIISDDRIFALSHLNFDLSVYDIFGALIAGAAMVIPDHQHYKNPSHWYEQMTKYGVTIWNSVPMLMQMLTEYLYKRQSDSKLRHILLSGDWIPLHLPEAIKHSFGDEVMITSLGGATEVSIWSVVYIIPKVIPKRWKSIPYGRPLRNQHLYVYDNNLNDCPEGVTGQLYIGGAGLADGYWKDEQKSKLSFIVHPLTGERLYCTGDCVRFVPDGYIEFMGRIDFQVKLHGHRIELGEIEYHLQQHLDVHQAVVTVDKQSQRLIGYIVPMHAISINNNVEEFNKFITSHTNHANLMVTHEALSYQGTTKNTIALSRSEQTEDIIDSYYARKSYRQFNKEDISVFEMETLLEYAQNLQHDSIISQPHSLNRQNFSRLLSVLSNIKLSDDTPCKYRYPSAGGTYSIQIYVELLSFVDDISPGFYRYNADEHQLDHTIAEIHSVVQTSDEYDCIARFHLIGRQKYTTSSFRNSSISNICLLETGYIVGLLANEAAAIGWSLTQVKEVESGKGAEINVDDRDSYVCFSLSTNSSKINKSYIESAMCPQIFLYFRYLNDTSNLKAIWYEFDIHKAILKDIQLNCAQPVIPDDMRLIFDETDAIFIDSKVVIFIIGRDNQYLDAGKLAYALMHVGIDVFKDRNNNNIGMCPIGVRTSVFDNEVGEVLNEILHHTPDKKVLHTLCLGKVSQFQKKERIRSNARQMSDCSQSLKTYLKLKLPSYMIPSVFMILDKLPLNRNGKLDRQNLPSSQLPSNTSVNTVEMNTSFLELEETVRNIWSEFLNIDENAIDKQNDFFDIGGDSLQIIQIYNHYQSLISFDSQQLNVALFLQHSTMAEHIDLLSKKETAEQVADDQLALSPVAISKSITTDVGIVDKTSTTDNDANKENAAVDANDRNFQTEYAEIEDNAELTYIRNLRKQHKRMVEE